MDGLIHSFVHLCSDPDGYRSSTARLARFFSLAMVLACALGATTECFFALLATPPSQVGSLRFRLIMFTQLHTLNMFLVCASLAGLVAGGPLAAFWIWTCLCEGVFRHGSVHFDIFVTLRACQDATR